MIRLALFHWALVLTLLAQGSGMQEKLNAARGLKQERSFAAAVKAYDAALPAVRSSGDRRLLATTLLEAGQSALSVGTYDRALSWATESADLFKALKARAGEAQACNAAGSASLYRGDYEAALHTFERALAIDRGQHDAWGEISRLSNIGSIFFFQGKYLDALDVYQQGLRRVEETAHEPWNPGRRQVILGNLAVLYEQLGQYQKALDYYQQVQAIGSALTPAEQGPLLSSMGSLYRRLGDAAKALEIYEQAQGIFAHGHNASAEIHILQNMGIAWALDFHDMPRALAAFSGALKLALSTSHRREIVLAHLFRGEAFYRMRRWAESADEYQEALTGARAAGGPEEEWTALYGLGRLQRQAGDTARALTTFRSALSIIESIRSGLGSSSLKTDFLSSKREVYDAAIDLLVQDSSRDPAQVFEILEHARSRNLQDRLRVSPAMLTLRALQSRLPEGTMVLDYWVGGGRVAALWITRRDTGIVSRTFGAEEESRVRALAAIAAKVNWRSDSEQLGDILLHGIPFPTGLRHLVIVPDGVLSAVSFDMLSAERGARILVQRFALSYLPSAALFFRNGPERKAAPPWRRRLVGFGDPIVNASGTFPSDQQWARLPESARELRSISALLPGRARLFTAQADLKRYFLQESGRGAPLLHISAHAVADSTDPNRSRIVFTPENGKPGSEYLFRGEVQNLSLSGVDLVTLSACDTEGGVIARGEGVQSFTRAFLAAGARSTVTTLWRVADGPAADFMKRFYERMARGETKAEALRGTKLDFLRLPDDRALPVHWAAFVLNGDGQNAIPPVYSWTWILLPGAVLVIGSLLTFRWVQQRAR